MIRCLRKHLEDRCRERGYTLEEVGACIVSQDGESITVDETHPVYPTKAKPGLTLTQKVLNFTASAARHIAAGMPQTTEEEVAARFAICQSCEHFDGTACGKCGCPVVREKKFLSKLSWANEKCPVGKWGSKKD